VTFGLIFIGDALGTDCEESQHNLGSSINLMAQTTFGLIHVFSGHRSCRDGD
jgi:hypothetical protein